MLVREQLSGLKINCDKSDLLTIGLLKDEEKDMAKIFCCKQVNFLSNIWVYLYTIVS